MNVSFLGLGVMGYPMAGHLSRHGYNVTVYNRNAEKAQRWLSEYAGEAAATPAAAAAVIPRASLACRVTS